MARNFDVTFIGPVVWGSVWGHGPELASYLSARYEVAYLDPPVPPRPAKNSFIDRGSYPLPERLNLIRRKSGLAAGALYGVIMELRNLWTAIHHTGSRLVTYYPAGSVLALLWCRIAGRRSLFVYADKPDIISHGPARWAAKAMLGLTARLARVSVATSSPLLDDLRSYTVRCELIPNGVNLERTAGIHSSDGGGTFTVGFAGVFGEWVDFELVLDTAAACPWARFLLIGDGPRFEAVRKKAENLPNVTLTGALPHEQVFSRLAGADACLVPFAVNELTDRVCPVKLFEYWALGKPVIATPCRELARLAGGNPLALHLAGDTGATARLLASWRDKPEALAEYSASAREAVKAFDWKELGKRFETLLGLTRRTN